MLARIGSFILQGIDALPCEIEIDLDPDQDKHTTTTVGLADTAVKESAERVRAALENSGYAFPYGRVLISLAPGDVRKEGPSYDLPMALGMLIGQGVIRTGGPVQGRQPRVKAKASQGAALAGASGRVGSESRPTQDRPTQDRPPQDRPPQDRLPQGPTGDDEVPMFDGGTVALQLDEYLFAGELALDGRVRPIKGVIAMAALAKQRGLRGVVVPRENAAEAAVVQGVESIGVATLAEVVGYLNGAMEAVPHPPLDVLGLLGQATAEIDFADVRGQESVKRAIVVAAAGSHNIFVLWRSSRHGAAPAPRTLRRQNAIPTFRGASVCRHDLRTLRLRPCHGSPYPS